MAIPIPKQISLTINKLTKEQYDALSAVGRLSSELSDQLFMTIDDAGGSSEGSVVEVNPLINEGTHIANITVDGVEKQLFTPEIPEIPPIPNGYDIWTFDFTDGAESISKKIAFYN